MRIAIVDDEKIERERLTQYVRQFSEESGIEMETAAFSSGDAFMEHYQKVYDIIIFDIDMPGTNGIDTARRLRKIDTSVTIIFVTNIAQYAINGYEVDAVDYIIKPILYYDFSMKFHRTVAKAAQKKEHVIQVETTEGVRRLRVDAIVYVEVLSHYLYIHTETAEYRCRGSMAEIEQELAGYGFVRIHRSYLVGLKYVEKILSKEVTVNGQVLPVGRGYKEEVKTAYMKYIRGEA